jgi:hypothetical protein
MSLGRVVHCKREEYEVYIGRPSEWGNPFSHKTGTKAEFVVESREAAVEAYRVWLFDRMREDEGLLRRVAGLRGKTLGCWCAPQACHGDVLARAAEWAAKQIDEREGDVDDFDPKLAAEYDRLEQLRDEIENPQPKDGMEMLDAAISTVMARTAPGRHVGARDPFAQEWVEPKVAVTEAPAAVCRCERDGYALQVVRAAEYNERRALDAPAWDVPEWVAERGAAVMEACPATIHFPTMIAEAWYGMDATTSADDDRVAEEARQYEDALAAQSSRSITGERWEGEYESYEERDRFVRQLTEERRRQLAALIQHLGQEPTDPKIVAWVKTRIAAKHGNVLRGYCSCIYALRRRVAA